MNPDISVIIATYERPSVVACLQALAEQTLAPSRFEVIVCDDGSRIPVATAYAPAIAALRDRLRLRILRQANAGPAAARNTAARAAEGRYLVFTDDDCVPLPNWLERLLLAADESPDYLLGGAFRCPPTADPYAQATQAIMEFLYAEQERRGDFRLFNTSNLAVPAEGFHAIGGFSTEFRWAGGEDYDFCARWNASGRSSRFVEDAVVLHDHPLDLPKFWRQHFAYGRGALRLRQRMRRAGIELPRRQPSGVPGGFQLQLILSPLREHGLRGLGCAMRIALSQVATAAGASAELVGSGSTSSPSGRPATVEIMTEHRQ